MAGVLFIFLSVYLFIFMLVFLFSPYFSISLLLWTAIVLVTLKIGGISS